MVGDIEKEKELFNILVNKTWHSGQRILAVEMLASDREEMLEDDSLRWRWRLYPTAASKIEPPPPPVSLLVSMNE